MKGPTGSPEIPVEEFADRRDKAVAAARARGLDGLLICARGGGTLDRYANLLYLANFYTSFPYIPDLVGSWTGRAHGFLVLPVDGAPILVADVPYLEQVALDRDQIIVTDTVIESVAKVLDDSGLGRGEIGLVGDDVLPVGIFRQIEALCPEARWSDADDILTELRAVKSPGEIERLRISAILGSRTIEAMMAAAVPGASHGDIVAAGMQVLVPAGGILYNSFMASGRGGDSPTIVRSSFPTWASKTPLSDGQWLRLGISGVVDGYYFDVSRSKPIGAASNRQIDAFEAAIAVVEAGMAAAEVGASAGDVATAGLREQETLGYPLTGVFSGLGHGIGMGWDKPWLVPGDSTELKPGMVLNFERTLMQDGFLGDFEETALVTQDGLERLTCAQIRYW